MGQPTVTQEYTVRSGGERGGGGRGGKGKKINREKERVRGKGAGKSTVLSPKLKYSTCTCIVHAPKGKFEAWECACVGACRYLMSGQIWPKKSIF